MSPGEARLVHVANLLVGGTGLVYAYFRYVAKPDDPFAVVHPWAGLWQHLHVVVAPVLVFALGMILRGHAWAGLRSGAPARRRSGALLLGLATPMILSGYLLQTAIEPAWRRAWVGVHLTSSALWAVITVTHLLTPRASRR